MHESLVRREESFRATLRSEQSDAGLRRDMEDEYDKKLSLPVHWHVKLSLYLVNAKKGAEKLLPPTLKVYTSTLESPLFSCVSCIQVIMN